MAKCHANYVQSVIAIMYTLVRQEFQRARRICESIVNRYGIIRAVGSRNWLDSNPINKIIKLYKTS